jgi:hypothetical protein
MAVTTSATAAREPATRSTPDESKGLAGNITEHAASPKADPTCCRPYHG